MIDTLRNHPMIGAGSVAGGSLLPFIQALSPYLQFLGLCIGLLIGGLTLVIKWRELNGRK